MRGHTSRTLMEVAPASDNAAMNRSIKRQSVALLALLAFVALLAVQPPRADAATPFRLPIFDLFPAPKPKPKPAPVKVIQPVQAPISADPAGPARGTIIMVHAGGWAGHDGNAQKLLLKNPGDLFL